MGNNEDSNEKHNENEYSLIVQKLVEGVDKLEKLVFGDEPVIGGIGYAGIQSDYNNK